MKGKKIKKELMQQALKKRAVKAPGSHAETAEDDGPLHGTPAASAPEARNPPKTNNLAAGNPSNQTAKSSSATEILKLLSKNPSAKIPDTIKRSKSLNAGQSPTGMQGQLPAACDSDGIRKDSLIVPPKPHKATLEPGDALGLSRRTEISSAKPKKSGYCSFYSFYLSSLTHPRLARVSNGGRCHRHIH